MTPEAIKKMGFELVFDPADRKREHPILVIKADPAEAVVPKAWAEAKNLRRDVQGRPMVDADGQPLGPIFEILGPAPQRAA